MVPAVALASAAPAQAVESCGKQPRVKVLSSGHGPLESIGIDSRGQLFFTDSARGQLLRLRRPGREPRVILEDVDGPGGIVFRRKSRTLLMGFGNTLSQAADGAAQPEAGLLAVNPRKRSARVHTSGLQMANGVARGPRQTIYASNDVSGGIDRVRRRIPTLNWAETVSPNGMTVDRARESLFVNQTFTAAAIQRVPLDDPTAATTYYAAPTADAAAGFDGLARDRRDRLYVAANGAGEIWRVDGPDSACVLAELEPFPSGPSDLSFGRKRGRFDPRNLYVTTFGGELLELVGARR